MFINDFIQWLDYPNWVWGLVAVYLCLPLVFYILVPYYNQRKYDQKKKLSHHKKAIVMVLGDLGHSPRMLYHVKNLVDKKNYQVHLFGYLQSSLPEFILDGMENNKIVIHEIPIMTSKFSGIVGMGYKVIYQHFILWKMLFDSNLKNSRWVLIQNPPILPLFHIIIIWKILYSPVSQIIIDWHNLNFSILQLKFEENKKITLIEKFLISFLKFYEFKLSSRFAYYNLTVSNNMKKYLIESIYPNATTNQLLLLDKKFIVVHDRPGSQFKIIFNDEKIKLMNNDFKEIFQSSDLQEFEFDKNDKIIISSTSFTKDEDFNILLESLKIYDDLLTNNTSLGKLLLIVTGKGPEKLNFLAKIKQLNFSKNIIIINQWFSMEDYPKIIGISDLAVSLHLSSSGIDLPMKILDFFGCGIPTISVRFPTIGELVKEGKNGYILKENSDKSLCDLLIKILGSKEVYSKVKAGAIKESENKWDDNWIKNLNDIF